MWAGLDDSIDAFNYYVAKVCNCTILYYIVRTSLN